MDTKYKDVTLDDYSVKRYEDSRNSFLFFVDMISNDDEEDYEDDYSDEASSLWQDFRDLMQPFFAQMDLHHTGLDYVFDSPIKIDGIEYTHLYLVENEDAGDFGYDDFYISTSDGEHIMSLDYDAPLQLINVADKLIAESREASGIDK